MTNAEGISHRGFTDIAREQAGQVWEGLHRHEFVVGMADGTLPPETYQFYVEQNLLYLPQYARAIAMGVAKSRDDAELAQYSAALANIVDVEIPQNQLLLDRVRDLTGDRSPAAAAMAPGTRNYTSYLLAVAATGDIAAIGTLIMPCAWSYGEIARRHIDAVVPHPVYSEWFAFFATDDYQALESRLRDGLDAEVARVDEARIPSLVRIFGTATQLEKEFWDMAAAGAAAQG